MKIKILILLLLSAMVARSQAPSNYIYRATRERLIANTSDSTLTIPAGLSPSLRIGGNPRAGAIFIDTAGGGKGLWAYWDQSWHHILDSSNTSSTPTLDAVMAAGSTLTADRAVNGASAYSFDVTNVFKHRVTSSSTISFTATDSSYQFAHLPLRIDTSTYKPTAIDASGNFIRLPYWITGGGATDSATFATRARVQKGIDSLGGIAGAKWSLAGNSVTSGWEAGDFLGTASNKSLLIKTNGLLRSRIDSAGAAGTFRQYFATSSSYADYGTVNANTYTLNVPSVSLTTTSAVNITSNSAGTLAAYNGGVSIGSLSTVAGTRLTISSQDATHSAINFVSVTDKTTKAAGDLIRLSDQLTFTNSSATTNLLAQVSGTTALSSGKVPIATTNGYLTDGFTYVSSKYVPTITGVTNVASTTADTLYYEQTGNTVRVWGHLDIDPTATGSTTCRINLPITSNIVSIGQLTGTGSTNSGSGEATTALNITGDTTNEAATLDYLAVGVLVSSWYINFTYRIY